MIIGFIIGFIWGIFGILTGQYWKMRWDGKKLTPIETFVCAFVGPIVGLMCTVVELLDPTP